MPRLNLISPRWRRKAILDLPVRRALFISVGGALLLALLRCLPSVEGFEARVSQSVEFRMRHWLGRDPALDSRIVIYGMGDSSLNELGQEELEIRDWASLLKAIAAAKPRAILIDKVFSAPLGRYAAPEFVSTLKSLGVPVIAGSFVSSGPIPTRALQPLAPPGSLFDSPSVFSEMDWLPPVTGYPYGPAPEIRDGFSHVGHVMYAGNLTVKPILRLGRQDLLLASAFFSAKHLLLRGGSLFADGVSVPLDGQGRVLVNLSYPGPYYDRTFKLSSLLKRVREGRAVELPPDAVVVLLPALFTGSADLQPTPFGIVPGGYLVTALVNSVLTGQWVGVARAGGLFLFCFALVGYLVLLVAQGAWYWGSLAGLSVLIFGGGVASFCYLSYEVPWLFSILSLISAALVLSAENGRVARRKLMAVGEAEKDFAKGMSALHFATQQPGGNTVRIGRYHVLEVVGSGGMGEVYRAKIYGAGGFEKEFAVKRILFNHLNRVNTLRQFEEEARLNSVLTHANIAQVFEFLRINETYLLVMEFIHGKNLAQLMTQRRDVGARIPIPLAVRIVDEICKGLHYAHSKRDPATDLSLNIIHRDVSPQNVMLSYEGEVKLIDFGIAKGKFHAEHTADGVIKGKFAYMSPEQARGTKVDQRSDLFSAGLILYELVTGARVLEGGTDVETIENVRLCRIPPATAFNPELPPRLDKILGKCLAKEADERYVSAAELHVDLQELLRESPVFSLSAALSELLKEAFPREYGKRANVALANAPTNERLVESDIPTRRLAG